jgi:methylase of polypeptide subunit release factors
MSSTFWNDRYSGDDLVYGAAPNELLSSMADRPPATGEALDIGAGEGRNALFLASSGLNVLAVDQSEVGMRKAQRPAHARGFQYRWRLVDEAWMYENVSKPGRAADRSVRLLRASGKFCQP